MGREHGNFVGSASFPEMGGIASIVLPSTDKFPYKFKSVVREGGGPHQQEALGQNLRINKS